MPSFTTADADAVPCHASLCTAAFPPTGEGGTDKSSWWLLHPQRINKKDAAAPSVRPSLHRRQSGGVTTSTTLTPLARCRTFNKKENLEQTYREEESTGSRQRCSWFTS